jgi:hypothetical protein
MQVSTLRAGNLMQESALDVVANDHSSPGALRRCWRTVRSWLHYRVTRPSVKPLAEQTGFVFNIALR